MKVSDKMIKDHLKVVNNILDNDSYNNAFKCLYYIESINSLVAMDGHRMFASQLLVGHFKTHGREFKNGDAFLLDGHTLHSIETPEFFARNRDNIYNLLSLNNSVDHFDLDNVFEQKIKKTKRLSYVSFDVQTGDILLNSSNDNTKSLDISYFSEVYFAPSLTIDFGGFSDSRVLILGDLFRYSVMPMRIQASKRLTRIEKKEEALV